MTLSEKDYFEFLNTQLNLFYFVGNYTNILKRDLSFQDFLNTTFTTKGLCRNVFLKNKKLLDLYLDGGGIPKAQRIILEGHRKSITGKFIFLKCLSEHAIFRNLKNKNFYAVKALSNSFEELIPEFPAVYRLNILPFKGVIVYDGFIESGNMEIGINNKKSLASEYQKAQKENQIITSLEERIT